MARIYRGFVLYYDESKKGCLNLWNNNRAPQNIKQSSVNLSLLFQNRLCEFEFKSLCPIPVQKNFSKNLGHIFLQILLLNPHKTLLKIPICIKIWPFKLYYMRNFTEQSSYHLQYYVYLIGLYLRKYGIKFFYTFCLCSCRARAEKSIW